MNKSHSHNAPPEQSLVQQAIAGDAEAFARLYDSFVDRVYRFLLFRVNDQALAEDLTSQIFLKVLENIERYQPRDLPFGAWVFRIARNTLIDYYRTHKDTVSLDADSDTLADGLMELDGIIEQQIESKQIREALDRLTEDQRQVLTLKFMSGLTTHEIAQVMEKRPGSIRALQMRGLQALAEILGKPDE